jgi:hypothetical protein
MFSPAELDLIICGTGVIDIEDWERNCAFGEGYDRAHPAVQRFFRVIHDWDHDKLSRLLAFITGSGQVPVGGFAAYREAGTPISIAPGGDADRLPCAHTCFHQLDLPSYESDEILEEKLNCAIDNCQSFELV